MDEEESSNNKCDSEWSIFLQDNKTLEQIDKDVRRTLPDFAFFQLPVPYSPLCPLSTEPKRRKPKKSPNAISGTSTIVDSGSSGSFPGPELIQKQLSNQRSSMDLRRLSLPGALTPTLKRRQTVTVMSPRAGRKNDKSRDTNQWQSTLPSSSSVGSGTETPPQSLSNGFKTPINHASPVPSRLRGMAATLADIDNEEESASLPEYLFSPIPTRRSLFKRVAHLNQDFGSRQHQPHSLQTSKSRETWKKRNQDVEVGKNNEVSQWNSTEPYMIDSDDSCSEELPQDLHWEAIERILFIYAKLNPGVGYIQGMNEILGPLYYLLANDPDDVSRDRDRTSGIGSTIARMNFRLRQFDENLWKNLEDKGIAPEYYSFRWLTVLFTQEFEVPDVWRIWDSVLADTEGVEKDYDFLLDFGCAMVCQIRTDLVNGDFADNVKLLQNYPSVDIQPILYLATVIRESRVNGTSKHTNTVSEASDNTIARPSIDLRIWGLRSPVSDYQGVFSNLTRQSTKNTKALTIDGVQNSDRLDYNLEGTDQRSPLYSKSTLFKKERPLSISGLDLDEVASVNGSECIATGILDTIQPSPSSLSFNDNYTKGKDSRPQTATWAETFAQFKMRIVGSGSSIDNPKTLDGSDEPIGALSSLNCESHDAISS
ncbi:hypothetical protein BGZ49_010420 [Haplosporangium sp. Z 27]|nr:hypothetical protein BGZ49_010420 [Haplosporangium sp. Z 27]